MRLLFLCHRVPYPPHKGEKIRAWNILKHLAVKHDVSLACLADEDVDAGAAEQLRRHASEILIERIRPRLRLAGALGSLWRRRPITVSYFYSRALQKRIDDLIDRKSIDGLLCSSSPMAEYVFRSRCRGRLARIPRVMDLIDVDSYKWRQYAAASLVGLSWLYRREARNLAAFERRIAREFERVLVVSTHERLYFPSGDSVDRLIAMPNGVDLDYFSSGPIVPAVTAGPAIVFTGVMSYRPNIDGILWFVDRIFPQVRSALPKASLYIVGSQPPGRVRRLGMRDGITVTGHVSDVRPYLAAASLCVVPLRIARGLQNKILEAMAMERAVVTTAEAFEGLEATPGRDLIVARDESEFAMAVTELLQNENRRGQIGRNARICVEKHYQWQRNLRLLDELFPSSEGEREAESEGRHLGRERNLAINGLAPHTR